MIAEPKKKPTVEEELAEIQQAIERPNQLIREIQVPAELAPALMTGRLELLTIAQPRPMDEDEVAVLYRIIGCYAETNAALVRHAERIGSLVEGMRSNITGVQRSLERLQAFANFQHPVEEDEE